MLGRARSTLSDPREITPDDAARAGDAAAVVPAPSHHVSWRWRVLGSALLIVLGLEIGVRVIEDRFPPPDMWVGPEASIKDEAIARLEHRGGASIAFVGSSTVDVSIDPSRMTLPGVDRPVYNAATGAGSLEVIDNWTRTVVVPRLSPDVVVIGVGGREMNPNDPVQNDLTRRWFDAPAVEHLIGDESLLERGEWQLQRFSALYRHRRVLRSQADLFDVLRGRPVRSGEFGEVVAADGRYEAFDDEPYRPAPEVLRSSGLHDYELGTAKLRLLSDLVADLEELGIDVLVVSMPTSREYLSTLPGGAGAQREFVDAVAGIAEAAGAAFVDVGRFPDAFLADAGHTNARGSAELTRRIEGVLARMLGGGNGDRGAAASGG